VSERDDAPIFGDHDAGERPLPDPRVAWPPALLVAFGVTLLTLLLTILVAGALDLDAAAPGEEATGDEAAFFTISLIVLALHTALLRYGLRLVAQYDVGLGWALLAAIVANVLPNLLGVIGLILAVPAQAAIIRARSEPRASLVGR
jgi:hypothetical protein